MPGPSGQVVELLGPLWDSALLLEVPGPLLSKSNFRRGGARPAAQWRSLSRFEQGVSASARAARPDSWQVPDAGVPLAQRPVVVSAIAARSLLDVGNFHKSLLDACQGVLFVSDAQVRAVLAVGERGRQGQRAIAGFALLRPASSLQELSAGVSALSDLVLQEFHRAAP